jgi:hypothetical protein
MNPAPPNATTFLSVITEFLSVLAGRCLD